MVVAERVARIRPEWLWTEVADPVTQYARDVVNGELIANRLVILACARHLRDLERDDLRFDIEEGLKACTFLSFQVQRKGPDGGKRLDLQAWQVFRIGSVFGWMRFDEELGRWVRRFQTAWNELGRKNGKTTEAAGIALYLTGFDGEPGAEVYCAATKRSQARQCYDEAHWMVGAKNGSKALRRRFVRHPESDDIGPTATCRVSVPGNGSYLEPLGMDTGGEGLHGLNPHGGIFDEIHAWTSREQWNVLTTAAGARLQPLIWIITTAGNNRNSIGYEQHEYAISVLEGKVQDDTWFVYIATVDDPDRWDDPIEWAKANPNLGVSVRTAYLQSQCAKAKVLASEKHKFVQLHTNQWVEQRAEPWMPLIAWDEQPQAEPLPGSEAFGGLDMASTRDLAAFCLWFPDEVEIETTTDPEGKKPAVVLRIPKAGLGLWWFWLPQEGLGLREQRGGQPWRTWVDNGWIRVTPGPTTNYDTVFTDIVEICGMYKVRSIGRDPWNSTQIGAQLHTELGIPIVEIPQTIGKLNEPTKRIEKLLLDRGAWHNGNPVMRWMFGNVVMMSDRYQNIRADRDKSGDKIDGFAAWVMAVKESMSPAEPESVVVWFPKDEQEE